MINIETELDLISDNFKELKKLSPKIKEAAQSCVECIKNGGKILLCGNGGSASDAQHLSAELVVKYKKVRKAIPAVALTTDTSILTAIGNDIGADFIFARQVEALGNLGDVLIGITTSGNSENVIRAFVTAKSMGIKTILLTGSNCGKINELADILIDVPSKITNNIQEMHIAVGHLICGLIEESI